ncbi:MAG: prepilin-type N-terminal cleavage/methylation domain-containing protein [Pyrinomonadaceae bacterium]
MNNERGFTLLETTIAMAVMLVVGLGATSLFFYAVRYNSGATDRTLETAVLQQRMEQYRTLPFTAAQLNAQAATNTIVTTAASSAYGAAPTSGGTTTGTGSDARAYDLTTTIEDVTTYAGGPVLQKKITLTVAPRNATGTGSWKNLPMTIVIRRDSTALGPYRR